MLGYPNKHTTITRGRGQGDTTLAPTLKKKPCKSTCDLQVTRTHHTQNIYMHAICAFWKCNLVWPGVYVYNTYMQWCVHCNLQGPTEQCIK